MNSFIHAIDIVKKIFLKHPFFWLVLIVGILARTYMFGLIPGGINPDEAFAGYNSYTLLHYGSDSFGYRFPVYLTAWGSGMNALESYLMVPFVALFGLNIWSIRIPMMLVGILSLVAVYYFVRHFLNEKTAIGAMMLLAISPWHVLLSRWALESNLAPGFVLFGMLFFIKGLVKSKYLIGSAIFWGLSFYSYATIWPVLPFVIFLCILYGIWTKTINHNKYTWISLAILIAMVTPLILFMMVNKNIISEIRLPFISIPKLVVLRDSDISFNNITENFWNFWDILKKQSDGFHWNYMEDYGLFYPFTLPFILIGFGLNIYNAVLDIKSRRVGIAFFLSIWLLAGFVIAMLIHVNVNRMNLFFIPAIIMAVQGIIFTIHPKAIYIPLIGYIISFVGFEKEYFTKYKDIVGNDFNEGIGEAIEFANSKLSDGDKMYVDPFVIYPRVLFYGKVDLKSYLSSVSYTNYPSPYLYVNSFDRYVFNFNENQPEPNAVYLLGNTDDRIKNMAIRGFRIQKFGNHFVAFQK